MEQRSFVSSRSKYETSEIRREREREKRREKRKKEKRKKDRLTDGQQRCANQDKILRTSREILRSRERKKINEVAGIIYNT